MSEAALLTRAAPRSSVSLERSQPCILLVDIVLHVALPLQVVQVIANGSSQTSALELAHLVDDGGDGRINVWLQSVVDVVNLCNYQRLGDW